MKTPVLRGAWLLLLLCLGLAGCRPATPSIPLPEAARKGQLKVVQQHIAARSDLNVKDNVGLTAAHHAAIRGDLPMMKALVEAGADLSALNAAGKTPLELARINGRPQVAGYLEQRPATQGTGRGLVDGGLGVSSVLDSQ